MSKPKNFLSDVAHIYRVCALDQILLGWVERAKYDNPNLTDSMAVDQFLEYHNIKEYWSREWANQCLQRSKWFVRENGGKI